MIRSVQDVDVPLAGKPAINRRVVSVGALVALPLLLILLANLGRDPQQVRSPLIGRPAPSFTLKSVGGGPALSLEGLRGAPVVLNFWSTWCGPCLEEHEVLTQAARDLGARAQFLGIVYEDDEAAVLDFLRQRGQAYPSLLDDRGRTAIAYGVFGVPETFFIDGQGVIVAKHAGPLTMAEIHALLAKTSPER